MRSLRLRTIAASAALLVLAAAALVLPAQSQASPEAPAGTVGWFEKPRVLAPGHLRYPQALQSGERIVLLYQRITAQGEEGGEMSVVGRIIDSTGTGAEFTVADGLPFTGFQPPPVFSAVLGPRETVHVALSREAQRIELWSGRLPASGAPGGTAPAFSLAGSLESAETLVSPKLQLRSDGGFVLLATTNTPTSQNTVISRSDTGESWTKPFMIDAALNGNINSVPVWAQSGQRELVVLQSLTFASQAGVVRNYYQLYAIRSDDAGTTWRQPELLTDFGNPGDRTTVLPRDYDNERPLLVYDGGRLRLFWERGLRADPRQIWTVALNDELKLAGAAEQVTNNPGGAIGPVWLRYRGQEGLAWFSASARGNRAFLSLRRSGSWTSQDMSSGRPGAALYPVFGWVDGRVHFFWYERGDALGSPTNLIHVEPDRKASPPVIAGDFNTGARSNRAEIRFRLLPPADVSGIAGYSWVVSTDPAAPVPAAVTAVSGDAIPPQTLPADGTWYIRARTLDKAGNWSEPATVAYTLDTTPPGPPSFEPFELDERGYLAGSDLSASWKPDPGEAVREYGYSLQYLGDISLLEAYARFATLRELPEMGRFGEARLVRRNAANGAYVLAVWSYDQVGNKSAPRLVQIFADKYVPRTAVEFVTVKEDLLGNRFLSVRGSGFRQNGTVRRVVLDRDGVAPWDFEFFLAKGDYTVADDRLIDGIRLDRVLSGSYLLGVDHEERGFEFSGRRLVFAERGIIKFGDYRADPGGRFTVERETGIRVQGGSLLLVLAAVLLLLAAAGSAFQIRGVVRDAQLLERTALAIATGGETPLIEAQRKEAAMKRKGLTLQIKFTIFFLLLVVAVVLLISLPLVSYSVDSQKSVLAKGLRDRLEVLMESLQLSSTIYLQNPDTYGTELGRLPEQGAIMPEVRYITITAQGRDDSPDFDTVWATNDAAITGEQSGTSAPPASVTDRRRAPFIINGESRSEWLPGRSGITDSLSATIPALRQQVDASFREGLGSLPDDLNAYATQLKSLVNNDTPAGRTEAARIDELRRSLQKQLDERMRELAGPLDSLPKFDYAAYDTATTDYIFYQPIRFRKPGESAAAANYYRGLVRIGVNTDPINTSIAATQSEITQRILIFALLAVAGGLGVAITLSIIIVRPIKRLEKGVKEIQEIIGLDVNSQERRFGALLKGGSLVLKSRDEIGTLASSVNDMVDGLLHAASANKDLVAGSDIQRKFMPLAKKRSKDGEVLGTIGGDSNEKVEIFGYYEGAKGVSGDFINFQEIAPGLWACIKCDISGKGIPAALIMVEVATVFLSYFTEWRRTELAKRAAAKAAGKTVKNDGILAPLVTTINDLINEREFKGRFAAFNIVLYDEDTGDCTFCNAGDSLLYILRGQACSVETLHLARTPAAGPLSSKPNEDFMPSFTCREEKNHLEPGDVLLFFTDGIDESRRQFRTPDFAEYLATADDVAAGRVPDEDHGSIGIDIEQPDGSKQHFMEAEQFTWDRANAVAEAVCGRRVYTLVKYINPLPDRPLEFDFRSLEGTGRDITLALAAVEKVFRIIPNPQAGASDRIQIDQVVDDFLKEHFVQYQEYFNHPREEFDHPLYREYTHLREENQFDDLAFLTIRRK